MNRAESNKLNSVKFAEKRRKTGLENLVAALKTKGLQYDAETLAANYVNNRDTVVTAKCLTHNHEFTTSPRVLLGYTHCCPAAARKSSDRGWYLSNSDVLTQFKAVHGDEYDYSAVVYHRDHLPVAIICREHGAFNQTPGDHKKGYGCSKCSATMEEKRIMRFLTEHGVPFEFAVKLKEYHCRKRFDFRVAGKFLVEYDGPQHFKPIYGHKKLAQQIARDAKSNKWCADNHVPLLRIPHTWPWQTQQQVLLEWISGFAA